MISSGLKAVRYRGRRARSAISRHGPIATNPHARRRSSTLPRQRRGPPCVAEASGAHCAGAPRATGTRASPNENRLVAPRVAPGRLSRRRRRVSRGRRAPSGRRGPGSACPTCVSVHTPIVVATLMHPPTKCNGTTFANNMPKTNAETGPLRATVSDL